MTQETIEPTRIESAVALWNAARGIPYAMGTHDCFLLACAAADRFAGAGMADEFTGRYTTPRGALRVLSGTGSRTLVEFWAERFEMIHPAHARPGDVAVALFGEGDHMAMKIDAARWGALTPAGPRIVRREEISQAFRIG